MGAAEKIWNATEVAETHSSEIPSSSRTIDHSLSLPEMRPRIVSVFCFFLAFLLISLNERFICCIQFGMMYNPVCCFKFMYLSLKLEKYCWFVHVVEGLRYGAAERELFKDLFKQWSNLDESDFSLETVSVLKVSVREKDGSAVSTTVRLYGPNTEYVIDRQRELQAIPHLSAAGFGAKLLGVFGNGMVQSFIDARTLTPSDMRKPKLMVEIAKQLRRFHEVEIPGSREPQLWNDISKFFSRALTLKFDDSEKQKKYEMVSFEEINKEIHGLKAMADRFNAPVVFCHNDLLSGNLMLNENEELYSINGNEDLEIEILQNKTGICCDHMVIPFLSEAVKTQGMNSSFFEKIYWADYKLLSAALIITIDTIRSSTSGKLYFIDFEYGSYSYRGFDLGNHFNEYAGYDCDYNLYPSQDEQFNFFRHYLKPDTPHEVSEEALDALYAETNIYMLASHLYWAIWALIQAKMSPIDFDYLSYFFLRYNEYKKQKEKCFSLAQSYFQSH
ncbi:hypothetical protein SASPL_136102 [Salvia splendens]|uniref:ethanolamine kinase n=1 Tax=Salvia splendens TaxID=180675 RepID=A0A8X8WZ68_SALSN|nr:hypothetical protein SASPL_136102 [Salvia splendens]